MRDEEEDKIQANEWNFKPTWVWWDPDNNILIRNDIRITCKYLACCWCSHLLLLIWISVDKSTKIFKVASTAETFLNKWSKETGTPVGQTTGVLTTQKGKPDQV